MNRKRWVLHRFTSYLDLIRDNFRKVLFSITFSDKSYPRGDLYGPQGWLIQIIKNILLFFVPLSSSVFRRNSFQYHIKYCDIIFMNELSRVINHKIVNLISNNCTRPKILYQDRHKSKKSCLLRRRRSKHDFLDFKIFKPFTSFRKFEFLPF